MGMVNSELYMALVDAGASEEKATAAAAVSAGTTIRIDAMSIQLYFLQAIGVVTLGGVGWIIQHLISH